MTENEDSGYFLLASVLQYVNMNASKSWGYMVSDQWTHAYHWHADELLFCGYAKIPQPKAIYKRKLILARSFRGRIHHGGGGMEIHGQSRKLRVHILNYPHKAESELEVEQGCELSKPAPSGIFPLASL